MSSKNKRTPEVQRAKTPEVFVEGFANHGKGPAKVQIRKKGRDCYKLFIYGESLPGQEEVVGREAIQQALKTWRLRTLSGLVITLSRTTANSSRLQCILDS